MTDLTQKIKRAQVRAGELTVVEDLHKRGLCMKSSCPFCAEQAQPMAPSLEEKLAQMVWYCYELRAGRRTRDHDAFNSYLDDPEVAEWLTRMDKTGRIRNTRFTAQR